MRLALSRSAVSPCTFASTSCSALATSPLASTRLAEAAATLAASARAAAASALAAAKPSSALLAAPIATIISPSHSANDATHVARLHVACAADTLAPERACISAVSIWRSSEDIIHPSSLARATIAPDRAATASASPTRAPNLSFSLRSWSIPLACATTTCCADCSCAASEAPRCLSMASAIFAASRLARARCKLSASSLCCALHVISSSSRRLIPAIRLLAFTRASVSASFCPIATSTSSRS
mmetsp:Transcript_20675/g.42023  ORF Transcript_20675/g.42023 Transcript_20675/m.42023 type:complete len:243 (+) Transcript_20675:60-788(+)